MNKTEIEKIQDAIQAIDKQKILAENKLKELKFWEFLKKTN